MKDLDKKIMCLFVDYLSDLAYEARIEARDADDMEMVFAIQMTSEYIKEKIGVK